VYRIKKPGARMPWIMFYMYPSNWKLIIEWNKPYTLNHCAPLPCRWRLRASRESTNSL